VLLVFNLWRASGVFKTARLCRERRNRAAGVMLIGYQLVGYAVQDA
jgi:hypothetical protein